VDGVLWDFNRVLEKSCTLCFVSSSTREGKEVIAHSSMHLLGQILELRFNCLLLGWRIDKYGQFYHDIANIETVNGRYIAVDVTQEDLTTLQTIAEMVIRTNFRFDRITVKKADLAKMFKYSEHRVDQIDEYIPDDTYDTVYRCGIFIDLDLSGVPHVRESSILKEFEVIKVYINMLSDQTMS
ncbi:ThrRS/AlaRS common domain-containing protein, partial [Morchella conica CCBAS932]